MSERRSQTAMMETQKRVRRTPDQARRLILDAAQAAIARTGPEGLRLQDIAAAAGISHPLILHHFGSRGGLAQRMAWLATVNSQGDPGADQSGSTMILKEIADYVHARRQAIAPPGVAAPREDAEWMVHLIAIAAVGDALVGAQLYRSAGIEGGSETDRRFRAWLAELIRGSVQI